MAPAVLRLDRHHPDRDAKSAERMFEAADAQHAVMGVAYKLPERTLSERAIAPARIVLGEAGFAAAWEAGRRRSLGEADAEALALAESIGEELAP